MTDDDDDDHYSSLSITQASFELGRGWEENLSEWDASAQEMPWMTPKPLIRQAATTTIILRDRPSRP